MEFEVFFRKVKENYPKAKKRFDEIPSWNEVDGLYRVYHNSFKMYYELQEAITDYLNVLFELTEVPIEELEWGSVDEKLKRSKKHYPSLEAKIRQLGFDEFFSRTVLEALNLEFESNNDSIWHEHQKRLTSAMYHSKTAVSCIMKVAEHYFKEGYIPHNTLQEHECICEHVMGFEGYRWLSLEELKERIECQFKPNN